MVALDTVLTAVLTGLAMVGAALAFFYRMGFSVGTAQDGEGEGEGENPAVNQRLDDLRAYLDTRFDAINDRFDRVDDRVDRLDEKVGEVEEDVTRVETKVDVLHSNAVDGAGDDE